MPRKNYLKIKEPRHLIEDKYKWIDRDEILLHYSFEILCDFVEKELHNKNLITPSELDKQEFNKYDGKRKDLYYEEDKLCYDISTNVHNEIIRLYRWWTIEYPEYCKQKWYDDFIINTYKNFHKKEDEEDNRDKISFMSNKRSFSWRWLDEQEHLNDLLNIRLALWS